MQSTANIYRKQDGNKDKVQRTVIIVKPVSPINQDESSGSLENINNNNEIAFKKEYVFEFFEDINPWE